jgi:GDP-L-fucose synthase
MNYKSKIYVAGHNGLVGSSILRRLKSKGYKNILIADRQNLDLTNQKKVFDFLKKKNLKS